MKKLIPQLLLAAILFVGGPLATFAQGFYFTTAAGLAGQTGSADGTNAAARFNEHVGIAADSAGTLYVADTLNHAIRKVTAVGSNWVVRTIAGMAGASGSADGSNAIARFFFPYGIAVGGGGTVYVADTYNYTIRKIVPSGTNWVVTTLAGTAGVQGSYDGSGGSASFNLPFGIAADATGYLYVADTYNHTLRRVAPSGSVTTIAGTNGVNGAADGANATARFFYPSGVAVDGAGNVFVADTYNSTIRKVTAIGPDWVVSTLAGTNGISGSADGTNQAARFNYPYGITANSSGSLFVADTFNSTIRRLSATGTNWVVTTVGGTPGGPGKTDGPGSAARFDHPYGVATVAAGNLYVADTYNDTIRAGEPGFLLQAAALGNNLLLSWPAAASNYILETRGFLGAAGAWIPATSGVVRVGDRYYKTNAMGSVPVFFRLHLP